MRKILATKPDDGGYYAIKGFLYQFDKTLLEVLENQNTTIRFENVQDINYEDYVLQVKHRETQKYTPAKVQKAVLELMAVFLRDPTKRLCLYCFFVDKTPQDRTLTLAELDSMIGKNGKKAHPRWARTQFVRHFKIRFSSDYKAQFEETLALIKSSFSLPSLELAVIYHCIFRSKLLELSLKARPHRKVRFNDLKGFLDDAEVKLFQGAYSKYVSNEKYERLIRKMYFTFTAPNIENFERLFLVQSDSSVSSTELIKIAAQLSRKFYKRGKSRQPYITFRNLTEPQVKKLKRMLLDSGIHFFDGTHFDGDRFRLDELAGSPTTPRDFALKVVSEENVQKLLQRIQMKEVFQFFVDEPIDLVVPGEHRRIQVTKTAQVLRMIT